MEEIQKNKKDNTITIMRALLLISIVGAHSSITRIETTGIVSLCIWKIWQVISIIGVPGFFAISGYLYRGDAEHFEVMCKKKVLSILIPWYFCGMVVYIFSSFPKYSLDTLFMFLVGHYSYLYYLTVLVVCFIIFYHIYNKTNVLIMCIIINICSLYFTQKGIVIPHITNFLNVFNWIGYFAIGCICKQFQIFSLFKENKKICIVFIALLGIMVIVGALFRVENYFSVASFVVSFISIFGVYSLAVLLNRKNNKLLIEIGNITFTIYLLHLPFVAGVKKIIRYLNCNLYVMIPIVVILLFFILCTILKNTVKNERLLKKIFLLLGMR